MTRWTEEDLKNVMGRRSAPVAAAPAKPRKYRNEKVPGYGGIPFDSKREARDFQKLEQLRIAGAIRSVIRQVSIPLPATRRRIRIDFLVVGNDGRYHWKDSKGFDTAIGKLKRQIVKDAYGIEIELI